MTPSRIKDRKGARLPRTPEGNAIRAAEVSEHKGRGVFACRRIEAGELLDDAPVVVFSAELLRGTPPDVYVFEWDDGEEALAFGLVSLCNHSSSPNARVVADIERERLELEAIRPIERGAEVTVDYACELWFDAVDE